MASIAGVSGSSSSGLIQMLQELARKRAESTSTSTSSQSEQAGATGTFDSRFEDALVSAGLDSSKLDELKSTIKSAVSSALSQTDGTTDPREVVGQVIEQTLADFGVDTDAVKQQMQSQMGSMRPSGPPPGDHGPGGANGFDTKLSDALTAAGVSSDSLEEVKSAIETAIASAKEDSEDGKDGDAVKTAVHQVLDQYGIDAESFDAEMESGMNRPASQGVGGSGGQQNQSYAMDSAASTNSAQWLSGLFQWIDEQA